MWRALQEEAHAIGEGLDFQTALRTAFLVFAIANGIYYLFYYLLYGLIDPGLIDLQREVMRESLEQAEGFLNEEQRIAMEESIEGNQLVPTVGKVLFTYAQGLLGGFIFSLGMAALASRKS